MMQTIANYEIDTRWKIIRADEAFCRMFRCSESGLIGRDVRELVRDDWRLDFRSYVARALIGIGEGEATVPMMAPCGQQIWFRHALEPRQDEGRLSGYRATLVPHVVSAAAPAKRWWELRRPASEQVTSLAA